MALADFSGKTIVLNRPSHRCAGEFSLQMRIHV